MIIVTHMFLIDKMLNMESMYLPLMNPSTDSNMSSMLLMSSKIQGDALVPVEIAVINDIFVRILGYKDFHVVRVKLVTQDAHQAQLN